MTSPKHPFNYPSNLDCNWVIVAGESLLILVRIHHFEMERNFDHLVVGNGEVVSAPSTIGSLTGNVKLRTITSSQSAMWMSMTSDNTGSLAGFYFELEQIASTAVIGKSHVSRIGGPQQHHSTNNFTVA